MPCSAKPVSNSWMREAISLHPMKTFFTSCGISGKNKIVPVSNEPRVCGGWQRLGKGMVEQATKCERGKIHTGASRGNDGARHARIDFEYAQVPVRVGLEGNVVNPRQPERTYDCLCLCRCTFVVVHFCVRGHATEHCVTFARDR